MNHFFGVVFIGFAAGILGTGMGGICALFFNTKGKRFMSFLLEFAAGLMIAVVCFDLLPEAFKLADLSWSIIGLVLGVMVIIYLDNYIKTQRFNKKLKSMNNRFLKTGILMGVGIALHNFPEGIAIGSGFEASRRLGFNLAFVIAIHNIPEGMAMALPMKAGGVENIKIFIYALMAGIPMGFGALIGALFGVVSNELIAICLSFAGGAMLYIVCGNLIPESKSIYKGRISTIGNILGIIIGIIISVAPH